MGASPSLSTLSIHDEDKFQVATKICEGSLDKQRRLFGGWISRYFILLDNGVMLSSQRTDNKSTGSGRMSDDEAGVRFSKAKPYLCLSTSFDVNLTVWEGESGASFQVLDTNTNKIHHFRAIDKAARSKWVTALRDCKQTVEEAMTVQEARMHLCLNPTMNDVMVRRELEGTDRLTIDRTPITLKLPLFIPPASLPSSTLEPAAGLGSQAGRDSAPGRQSIRESIRHNLLSALVATGTDFGSALLVLDEPSMKTLSAVCTMSELAEYGVGDVVSLEQTDRPPLAGYDVIYMVFPDHLSGRQGPTPKIGGGGSGGHLGSTPSRRRLSAKKLQRSTSVQRIVADWEVPFQRTPLYTGSAHLFFLREPAHRSETLVHLEKAKRLRQKMVNPPMQVVAGMRVLDHNFFSLSVSTPFSNLYAPDAPMSTILEDEATRLAEACVALGEFPVIRSNVHCIQATILANRLQVQLEEKKGENPGWIRHGMDSEGTRAQLIVFGRSEDLVSPLLHSFRFEVLLRDLLEAQVQEDRIELTDSKHSARDAVGGEEKKDDKQVALLNPSNTMWSRFKSEKLDYIQETVPGLLQRLKQSAAARIDRSEGKDLSLSEFSRGVSEMRQYQAIKKQLNLLTTLCLQCLDTLKQFSMQPRSPEALLVSLRVASMEQALSLFGVSVDLDASEAKVKTEKLLLKQMQDLMEEVKDPAVKERLLALWAVTYGSFGGKPESLQSLLNSTRGIRADMGALLAALNHVDTAANELVVSSPFYEQSRRDWKKSELASAKDLIKGTPSKMEVIDRHMPLVGRHVGDMIDGKLDAANFPAAAECTNGKLVGTSRPRVTSARRRGLGAGLFGRAKASETEEQRVDRVYQEILDEAIGVGQGSGAPGQPSIGRQATQPRVIVYIVGGASYYELHKLQELGQTRGVDVVVGTDGVLTPSKMMKEVEELCVVGGGYNATL